MMGKIVYSKEAREKAYDMYWQDRNPSIRGKRAGKYSLSEISKVTGMHRAYISKIVRGIQ